MAAATPKLSIDVLLVNHDTGKPYIEIEPDYRSDGGASEAKIKEAFDFAKRNLEAGTEEPFEGAEYKVTRAGKVIVLWIEIENSTPDILKDGQAWLDQLGVDWTKVNTEWVKQRTKPNKGYTGFALQKK